MCELKQQTNNQTKTKLQKRVSHNAGCSQWNYDTHTPEWRGEQHGICQAVSLPARNWAHDHMTTRHMQTHGWPPFEQINWQTFKTPPPSTQTKQRKQWQQETLSMQTRNADVFFPALFWSMSCVQA
jgi:hypothetical protein